MAIDTHAGWAMETVTPTGEGDGSARLNDADGIAATFPPVAESVRAARRFVERLVPSEFDERAVLLVSELATNAVLHARSPFEVRVRWIPTRRIEVRDASIDLPKIADPSSDDLHGRGLRLVDSFSAAWGISPEENGKVVWFEF